MKTRKTVSTTKKLSESMLSVICKLRSSEFATKCFYKLFPRKFTNKFDPVLQWIGPSVHRRHPIRMKTRSFIDPHTSNWTLRRWLKLVLSVRDISTSELQWTEHDKNFEHKNFERNNIERNNIDCKNFDGETITLKRCFSTFFQVSERLKLYWSFSGT